MRRIVGPLLGLFILGGTGSAFAQGTPLDCSAPGSCTEIKYGLGFKSDYRKDEMPPSPDRYLPFDFGPSLGGASFFESRTDLLFADQTLPSAIGSLGYERSLSPTTGMVFLRKLTACTPTGFGPTCAGGVNAGKDCHIGVNPADTATECPLSTCQDSGGGCRVEIPLETADGGVTPTNHTSELKVFTVTIEGTVPRSNPPATYSLLAETGNTFGGTSSATDAATGTVCPIRNRRLKPSMGTLYLLPDARRNVLGLPPGATFIRWDSSFGLNNPTGCTADGAGGTALCQRALNATNFRYHTDDTRLCCNPKVPGDCTVVLQANSPEYPLLVSRQCFTSGRPFTNDDNMVPDFIFEGPMNETSRFFSDTEYVRPGIMSGLCRNNRAIQCFSADANTGCLRNQDPFPCCTGAGTGTCGDPCPGLGGDTCDFREPGYRVQTTCGYDSNFDAPRNCGGTALYVLRGQPNHGCSLLPRMQYDGDPGSLCSVSNFGIDHRYDDDCNGVDDTMEGPNAKGDLCPFLTEWNQTADHAPPGEPGDCADQVPGTVAKGCRGDECECGDVTGGPANPPGTAWVVGDGMVTVSDLVADNIAIFDPNNSTKNATLGDANNDIIVTVSDLVGINREIFVPDSSVCRHLTPRICGRFCFGGTRAGKECTAAADCPGTGTSCAGIPSPCCGDGDVSPREGCDDAGKCVGGSTAGQLCTVGSTTCGRSCKGGTANGSACTDSSQCPGTKICSGGSRNGQTCTGDPDCPRTCSIAFPPATTATVCTSALQCGTLTQPGGGLSFGVCGVAGCQGPICDGFCQLTPSDGCNGACRIEYAFKCNPGSPSKCCPESTVGDCP